ncbi:hypothetical protein ACFL2V_20375 [Pseudomonadota bacterium]
MKLGEAIDELGGKNGVLEHLRDKDPRGEEYLLPRVLIPPGGKWVGPNMLDLADRCDELGVDLKVIVRPSERSDYRGMVDTMLSKVCDVGRVPIAIDAVRKQCASAGVLEYARREGNDYDPERISISVAPFIPEPYITVTEHPNWEDLLLIDVRTTYNDGGVKARHKQYIHRAFNYVDGECDSPSEEHADKGVTLQRRVRETGVFPDDRALQYEYVIHPQTQKPMLVQVREFAKKNSQGLYSEMKGLNMKPRNFGVTSPKGVQHKVVKSRFWSEAMRYELMNPGALYVLATKIITRPLEVADCPVNMRGYITRPRASRSLSHQNTRFVQMCLRHEEGFAALGTSWWDDFEDRDTVHVTMNGDICDLTVLDV